MLEQQLQQQQQHHHVGEHVRFVEPKSAQTSAQSSGNSSYNGLGTCGVTLLLFYSQYICMYIYQPQPLND